MRRLFQRAFNGAVMVSAVLFVTTCVLWAYSLSKNRRNFAWGNSRTGIGRSIAVSHGTMSFQTNWGSRTADVTAGYTLGLKEGPDGGWDTAGFHFHRVEWRLFERDWTMLPGVYGNTTEFWFELIWPLLLSLPLSIRLCWIVCASYSRRQRFRRAGRCLACGYDLRAAHGRCPECGAVPVGLKTQPTGLGGKTA
jgi:hypothetical protein